MCLVHDKGHDESIVFGGPPCIMGYEENREHEAYRCILMLFFVSVFFVELLKDRSFE